ncbi:MAG TPA: DNA primase [Gemmatimonadaceae bacterium]|nr:DNA primase [Gemmatimonadaceae bacterium]
MIPDDIVERVREQADIVAIVGELVKLKRVGSSFRGPCPFHQGKDPNFSVSPRGAYHCFVCHEKGDVFSFVQKRLGLDFVEAVKYVGAKAGVEVKDVSREKGMGPDPREKFWEINAAAVEFFTRSLWEGDAGAPAREYLASRGFTRDIADRYALGYSPRDPSALRAHLASLGFDDDRQRAAGLMHQREGESELRPRFRNRLMFPIFDVQGRAIAFGGRIIGQGEPKYLNSAETPVFVKGGTLYGLNWAKNAVRRDERVLLVEGYFDCLRLHVAGIESAVAPLGTALTEAQAELIRKYATTVFLLYDSDKAGLKATFRAGDVLLRHGVKVHVVTLPDGEDPDTFVRAHGKDRLEVELSNAVDVFERKIQILQRGGWFSDLRRKRVALDRLLPTVRAASDAITRGLYVARAAEAVGVSEDVLLRELEQPNLQRGRPPRATEMPDDEPAPIRQGRPPSGQLSPERELVRLLLHRRQDIEAVAEHLGPENFREPWLAEIFTRLVEEPDASFEALANTVDDDAARLFQDLVENRGGLQEYTKIIKDSIAAFRQREIGERMRELDEQMTFADADMKDRLNLEKERLQDELRSLGAPRHWKKFKSHRP